MLPYRSALFLEFETFDVTKRSMSSSFCFKLRRNKAYTGAEGYDKGSWHERTNQNDQRQGKKEDSNSSTTDFYLCYSYVGCVIECNLLFSVIPPGVDVTTMMKVIVTEQQRCKITLIPHKTSR